MDPSQRRHLDAAIARLAAEQFGVLTRAQARRLGATRDAIRARIGRGWLLATEPGVLAIAGSPRTWHQRCLGTCLAHGDHAVVTGLAAAFLHGLQQTPPSTIEITVPRSHRMTSPGSVRRRVLDPDDVVRIGPLPLTTPARTLLDLAAIVKPPALVAAVDHVLLTRLATVEQVRLTLARAGSAGRPGAGLLRSLIETRAVTGVAESELERRLERLLERSTLPVPVRQHHVRLADGRHAVLDFAYPDVRVGIEADGFRWHGGRRRWDSDRARANALTLAGWLLLHVTDTDLARRPAVVIEQVRAALHGRMAAQRAP